MTSIAGQGRRQASSFTDGDTPAKAPLDVYAMALSIAAVLGASTMVLSALFSFGNGRDLVIFVGGALALGIPGVVNLRRPFSSQTLRPVGTMSAVVVSFLGLAVVSTLVYLLTGSLSRIDDALYESVTGVSTSALTVFDDPAVLSDGVLIWRAATQWLGGVGALILAAGLLPFLGGSRELVGGPQTRRNPRTAALGSRPVTVVERATKIYVTVTVAVAFAFLITGMGLRDAVAHALSTVSTGGFSTHRDGIGHFESAPIEFVAIIAMVGAGSSVAFAWILWRRAFGDTRRAFELQVYLGVVSASTLWVWWLRRDETVSAWRGLREALFTVVSAMTTTGHRVANWGDWHPGASLLLLLLLVVGGTAGSVAGGLRWIRVVGMAQFVWRELQRQLHPRSIRTVKVGGSTISEASVDRMHAQMVYVMSLGAIASLVLALFGEGITEAITLTLSAISTMGPGFDDAGGITSAAELTRPERAVLMPVMLTGRVFLYPAFIAAAAATSSIARVGRELGNR